jgi:hypothetical protein
MTRKSTRRRHYNLVNPILHALAGAAITDTASLDKLRMVELSAIEAFRTGKATRQEWCDLADLLNISETMARDGIGPEALEPCMRAQEALGEAHRRLHEHGRLAMTGPEIQALREAYAFADLQRASISRQRFEQAIAKTAARIRSADPSIKVCMD